MNITLSIDSHLMTVLLFASLCFSIAIGTRGKGK
jgi:hypothetical protein